MPQNLPQYCTPHGVRHLLSKYLTSKRRQVLFLVLFALLLFCTMVPFDHIDDSAPPHAFPRLLDVRPRAMSFPASSLPPSVVPVRNGDRDPPSWCTEESLSAIRHDMSGAEASLLSKYVRGSSGYFEWGVGSPSMRAISGGAKDVTLVDTSLEALDCVLSHPSVFISEKTIKAFYVDIASDPNNWGQPEDLSKRDNWPKVSDVVLYHPKPERLDTVFIDGRTRASCIVKSAAVLRRDAVIICHDYWARKSYHIAVEQGFLRVVETVGSIVVLQRTEKAEEIDSWADKEQVRATWKALFDIAEKNDRDGHLNEIRRKTDNSNSWILWWWQ